MFCPRCKAEYRPGFTCCSDCQVNLVEQLPESLGSERTNYKRIWYCEDRESCVSLCSELSAAAIPFKVTQRNRQFFWRLDEQYEIWVPDEFYDAGKVIAEDRCFDFSDSSEDQKIMELPDAGPGVVKRDNENWRLCSEDATTEVWSEKMEEGAGFERVNGLAWMIELSLNENGIDTHSEVSQDGFRKLFVKPEDELQAREIVREIESGIPPS